MRLLCLLLVASLVAACAPGVGAWRADGGVAADPAARSAEPRAVHRDDHGHGRLDDADEVVGCLGQAAVIGGIAAVIYLTRFRGGGGGGGDVAEREAPVEPAAVAAPWLLEPEPLAEAAADPQPAPGERESSRIADLRREARAQREAAAIVEAELGNGSPLRPCGAICTPAPAAP